ncbi:MAG TPA: choice-of-anchor D domain-containing protein [Terriglobales bacterium]|nr:choice-of-anchor D domain-containing protein [Terriglobales bacterium]
MTLPQRISKSAFSLFVSVFLLNVAFTQPAKGQSAKLVANPKTLTFGSVQSGSTATLSVTVTNEKGQNVKISSDSITGASFSMQGLTVPLTLTPGQSYTFTIAFSPQSAASVRGSFKALNAKNSTLVAISLSGTGTAAGVLSLSPASATFGNVNVGSASSTTGTLSASGASVVVTSVSSSSGEFALSGISFPATIAPGKSASYTVTFKPQSSGAASGALAFVSNASDSVSESLTGTGVAVAPPPPATYTVNLGWDASTSSVAGYNVYRGSISGGPYSKLNSTLNSGTTYADSSVAASSTYYYVTTAVNSNGQESTYSNQVQVVVP